jgi:hypothetical protein
MTMLHFALLLMLPSKLATRARKKKCHVLFFTEEEFNF